MKTFFIHHKIGNLMAERGLTEDTLAALADVSRQTIVDIEHGHTIPLSLAYRIADALDLPISTIFSLREDRIHHALRHRSFPLSQACVA